MIKFRGKAILPTHELNDLGIEHDNGWVVGSWVDGQWIIGEILEITDEYIQPAFWVKVDPSTVKQTDLFNTLKSLSEIEFEELTNKYGVDKGTLIFHGMAVNEALILSDQDAEAAVEAIPNFL